MPWVFDLVISGSCSFLTGFIQMSTGWRTCRISLRRLLSDFQGDSFRFWICLKTVALLFFYPESSACSPLSWLLSEYLDNAELVQRFKSRAAIFNSRVRRLTHLLVHVDTSQPDSEELKPPVKSSKWNTEKQNLRDAFVGNELDLKKKKGLHFGPDAVVGVCEWCHHDGHMILKGKP